MPAPLSLEAQIRAVLALDPSANAIEFEGRWHAWGEIAEIANATERALADAGHPEGAPVGMLLRNRPEMVAAMLGVLVSKRCIVTINPHQGRAKLGADLVEIAAPAVVACEQDWNEGVDEVVVGAKAHGFVVGRLASQTKPGGAGVTLRHAGSAAAAAAASTTAKVAVQMLTSGTTGKPKRIELHRSALAHSLLGAKHYEKQSDPAPRLRSGVAIINAPLVHIGGLFRTLQCIADGRNFALLEKFRVDAWLDCVVRHQPKTASLVPAALRMVLEADLDPEALSSIKAVVSGTAPLPPADAEAFEAKYGVPVLSSYGATEFAGGVAGWNLADHRRLRAQKRGSVGRAHPGCELRIVDPQSAPGTTDVSALPPGEEGLLEVRSVQLGPHADWVRTTDRARMDADGFLWIVGRADAAIVRGGFKIHPDEVRAALEGHPEVREAAVVGLPDDRLGHVPVAAVVRTSPASELDEQQLRAHAREHLTHYQVPARFLFVDQLPRTPSMKVSQPEVRALFEAASADSD